MPELKCGYLNIWPWPQHYRGSISLRASVRCAGRNTCRRTASSFWGSGGDMAEAFSLQSGARSGGAGRGSKAGERPRSKPQCWTMLAGLGQGHPALFQPILLQTSPRESTERGKRVERCPLKCHHHHHHWWPEPPPGMAELRSSLCLLLSFLWGHWKCLECSSSCKIRAEWDGGCPPPVLGAKQLTRTTHQLTGRAETS